MRPLATLALIWTVLISSSGSAEPCVDYAEHFGVAVEDRTLGNVYAIAKSGDVLYLALSEGLTTFDLTNPLAPARIATAPYPLLHPHPTNMRVIAGFAYLTHLDSDTGRSGLTVFDVSDPEAPAFRGNMLLLDTAWDVDVAGTVAFVANGVDGVRALDVSDPTRPALLSTTQPAYDARGLVLHGTLGIVAEDMLRVYDFSDPLQPTIEGEFEEPLGAAHYSDAAHDGDLARVVVGRWRTDATEELRSPEVQIIDASDPGAITLTGALPCPGIPSHILVDGDLAFVGFTTYCSHAVNCMTGVQIVDISDPINPVELGALGLDLDQASGMVRHGDVLYVASRRMAHSGPGSLRMIELHTLPSAPTSVQGLDPSADQHLATAGDLLALGGADGGGTVLHFVDADNPTSSPLSSINLGSPLTTSLLMPSPTLTLCGTAAPNAPEGELHFLDTTDPRIPILRATVPLPVRADHLAMDGPLVYGVGYHNLYDPPYPSILAVIDASDVDNPELLGHHDGVSGPTGVAVYGGIAYVSAREPTLTLFDVSQPSNPTLIDEMQFGYAGLARGGITIHGDTAFLLFLEYPSVDGYSSFLVALSLADPTAPAELDRIALPGESAYAVTNHGEVLYVANGGAGTVVVDGFDPSNLQILGGAFRLGKAKAVAASGESVFTLLTSLPYSSLLGMLVSPAQCGATAISAPVLSAPTELDLRVRPNPFYGSATIEFTLDRRAAVDLSVFDVTGRRVARLAEGVHAAGTSRRTWDGRVHEGRDAAAGVYWLVLSRDRETLVRKAIHLR